MVRERAREVGLAGARRTGDRDGLRLLHPTAVRELADQRLVEVSLRRVVDVFDARRGDFQFRVAQETTQAAILAMQRLGVDEEAEALVEAERADLRVLVLLEPGIGHAVEVHVLEFVGGRFVHHRVVLLRVGCSVVVLRAADVLVLDRHVRRLVGAGWQHRLAVEPVFEDRLDVPVRVRARGEGPGARRLDTLVAVRLRQAEQAEASTVALLGMRTTREDLLDEDARAVADLAPPVTPAATASTRAAAGALRACARPPSCAGASRSSERAMRRGDSCRAPRWCLRSRTTRRSDRARTGAGTGPSRSDRRTRRGSRC